MKARVAIHCRAGSFSDRWTEYCRSQGLDFAAVNGFSPNIISELRDFTAFVWHWSHTNADECLAARHVLHAASSMGLKVFPDLPTSLSFDNKIAQKYQLEAINAPTIPTHVFFDEEPAMKWVESTTWPKVHKLSRGAGSRNVTLVTGRAQAVSIVRRAFSRGFPPASGHLRENVGHLQSLEKTRQVDWGQKLLRLPRTLSRLRRLNAYLGRDVGYVYFQDFVPGNAFDIRVTVIGKRAFAYTRNVRKNDFRASGSGDICYDNRRIPSRCIEIAFDLAEQLAAQSIAFDFLTAPNGELVIAETSYCYVPILVYDCPGYWDRDMGWHDGNHWPQDLIIEDLLSSQVVLDTAAGAQGVDSPNPKVTIANRADGNGS